MAYTRIDHDNIWKEIIQQNIGEFLSFFLEEAYLAIDWSRPPEFLDKELAKINRKAKSGKRVVDKLVKVFLKNGEETWILIHIEVQSYRDTAFQERMFSYNRRINEFYGRQVASLAILTDMNSSYRPSEYKNSLWGTETSFKFPIRKLLDYGKDFDKLENNPNPFALVVMAYLKVKELKQQVDELYGWKIRLVRLLYNRGYSRQQIITFFWFLDWLIALPPELEEAFDREASQIQGEKNMPIISRFEERAIARAEARGFKKGEQLGEQREAKEFALQLINKKFGIVEPDITNKISKLDTTKLHNLGLALLDFSDKDQLIKWLQINDANLS